MMMMLLMEIATFHVFFTRQQEHGKIFDSSGYRENFAINQPEIRECHFVTVELRRHAIEQNVY